MLTDRIRIGIDGREFTERTTGIARLLGSALEEISRIRPEWEFVLYGNQTTVLPFQSGRFVFRRLPERVTFWWDQVTLVEGLKKEKVSLFLSPYYKIPLFAPCPVIHILHDLIILTHESYRSPRFFLQRSVYDRLGRLYARRADLILTDSFYSKKWIQKIFKVPADKIEVIYPGLDRRFTTAPSEGVLASFQKSHHFSSPYFLYVGNFKPHKKVDLLLQAYANLPESLRARYPLVLAGSLKGWGASLKKSGGELGLSGGVIFTDYVDEAALAALYQNAFLFIFPSLEEGFGFPLLEAMACGVPVIASRCSSIPEVVGDAAMLVPPGDPDELTAAVARLVKEDALRDSLRRKGLERASAFSVVTQAEKIASAIESVLQRKEECVLR